MRGENRTIGSAPRRSRLRLALVSLSLSVALVTLLRADDEIPDADFLEYLGSFGAEEEDWVNLAPGADVEEKIDALLAANKPQPKLEVEQEDETHE